MSAKSKIFASFAEELQNEPMARVGSGGRHRPDEVRRGDYRG
jgi:hypothetical protein